MKNILVFKKGESCLLGLTQDHWEKNNLNFVKVNNFDEMLREVQNMYFLFVILEADNKNVDCIANMIVLLRNMINTPIAIVSNENLSVKAKVAMLNNGADNVYSLPITLDEGLASIFAQIRRYTELNKPINLSTIIYSHGILINFDSRKVSVNGIAVDLLRKEFDLLSLFIRHPGRVLTYETIFCEVWGEEYIDNSKETLWVQLVRLRKKIQISPNLPNFIKKVHGVGYSFDPLYMTDETSYDTIQALSANYV